MADQSLTKQTLSGLKWSYISTIIQFALQVANFTVMAHLLGPREFGIVGMATIFTNFIERVGFLGVGQALVQRKIITDAHIRCGFALCLLFGVMFFIGFSVAAPWIAWFFDEPALIDVLRIVSFSFVLACIAEVPFSLLQRDLRFRELMMITNTSFLIGNGVVGIVLAFRTRPQRLSLDFSMQEVKDLLSIGIGFSLGRMTNYCALVGDNFMAGKMLGAQALGLYTRAYQLMTAPATYFGQVLERVFFAAIAQRQDEPEKVRKYHLYGIELSAMISVTAAILLSIAAPEVVTVLFGKQWLDVVPTVRVVAFGVFFRTCYKNSDTIIRAMGAVYSLAFRQTLYAAAVLGGAWFGSRWGIEGVATAVVFAIFLNYALLSYLCGELIDLPWSAFGRAHLPAIWLGVWQLLALNVLFDALRSSGCSSFVSLPCGVIVDMGVSLLALWLAPRSFRPHVFGWLAKHLDLERYGAAGRFGQVFLLRRATA